MNGLFSPPVPPVGMAQGQFPQQGMPSQMPQAGQAAQMPNEGQPSLMPQEGQPALMPNEQAVPPKYSVGDPHLDRYINLFLA